MSALQCKLVLVLYVMLGVAPALGESLSYDQAFSRSYGLEDGGDPGAAARVLETLIETYPQDFALHLRLGWLCFQAKRYEAAREYYIKALELNSGSGDAMLGLAWCQYYLGARDKARAAFEGVLYVHPDNASARQGLKLSRPVHALGVFVSARGQLYPGHPVKESATGLFLRVPVRLFDSYVAGCAYRYGRFTIRDGNGPLSSWDDDGVFTQHEAWSYLGADFVSWGLTGGYAYVSNDAAGEETVHVAGAVGRWSPWGHIRLSANRSFYESSAVYRTGLSWQMPVNSWLDVTPGGAWQYGNENHFWNGSLSLSFRTGRFSAVLGGKYGEEYRPAYLDQLVVYNIPDMIDWGGWGVLTVASARGFSLSGVYEYQHLTSKSSNDSLQSGMHVFVLTAGWTSREGADGTR